MKPTPQQAAMSAFSTAPNTDLTREQLVAEFEINPETGSIARIGKKEKVLPQRDGYLRRSVFGKRYLEHRLMWLYVYGEFPSQQIDHINRVRSDNRISNLRLATCSENKQNQGNYKNNTSGHKGVRFKLPNRRWAAVIGVDRKRINLGLFATYDDAVKAYVNASAKYHPMRVFA